MLIEKTKPVNLKRPHRTQREYAFNHQITKSPFNNFLSRVVKCRPHVVQGKMEMVAVKAVPVAGRGFTDFQSLVVDVEQEAGERPTVVQSDGDVMTDALGPEHELVNW